MDYTAIIVAIITGITSIGAVSAFIAKYVPSVIKYSTLAKDAVETLADVADALKDGNLSVDEITKLKADIAKFKADLA